IYYYPHQFSSSHIQAPPTTATYTLSLHDALPIFTGGAPSPSYPQGPTPIWCPCRCPRQARHMQVALITDLGAITEECARVAESLGVMLTVLPPDSGGWQSASLILLGEDVREAPEIGRASCRERVWMSGGEGG